jgi:spore coat protein H
VIRLYLPAGLLWVWLAFQQPCAALALPAKDAENQAASQEFFTNAAVCEIHIEIPAAGAASLKKESRKNVRASVKEGTNSYADVGVHLKGNSTFRPIDGEKPSFTLKFNWQTPGQRFHGLNKISLNNSQADPSYLNEALCTGLFRSLGVPVARITHERVWLNERYLGLYILVEGMTKDFLKLNFKNGDGNLYEGNSKDIDEEIEQINGLDTSRADLAALVAAAREMDARARWQRLHKVLDVDRFVSMMAGEVLMSGWDGYYNDCNNYRLYHDPATVLMVMMPHGLDNMFQTPETQWRPELHSLLVMAVLQSSEGQDLYRQRFWTAFEGPLRTDLILGRLDQVAARLRPTVA